MKVLSLALLCSPAFGGNTATWITYTDDKCTVLCPVGASGVANTDPAECSTTVDVTSACNRNSESSNNGVVCLTDKITYTNFPNTGTAYAGTTGCDAGMDSFANELAVGVCTYFVGPVPTWKMIDASTYTCTGGDDYSAPDTTDTTDTTMSAPDTTDTTTSAPDTTTSAPAPQPAGPQVRDLSKF